MSTWRPWPAAWPSRLPRTGHLSDLRRFHHRLRLCRHQWPRTAEGRVLSPARASATSNPRKRPRRSSAVWPRTLGQGGKLIIGVDLKKDIGVLEAAYDDAAGVTARVQSEPDQPPGGDASRSRWMPSRFSHRAEYNAEIGAIQMFLDVLESHEVNPGGSSRSSCGRVKPSIPRIRSSMTRRSSWRLAARAGFTGGRPAGRTRKGGLPSTCWRFPGHD